MDQIDTLCICKYCSDGRQNRPYQPAERNGFIAAFQKLATTDLLAEILALSEPEQKMWDNWIDVPLCHRETDGLNDRLKTGTYTRWFNESKTPPAAIRDIRTFGVKANQSSELMAP